MPKDLDEMSLEELWRLFPIVLSAHDARWTERFAREKMRLTAVFPARSRISHIGSTAIEGIEAKPIVDILAEVPEDADLNGVKAALISCGWLCMSEGSGRKSFNKGYTPEGYAEEVFHLHLRYIGDNDELYFRDYLRDHAAAAKEYAALKKELAARYRYDRDAYTAAKGDFVRKYTEAAKSLYGQRY